MAAIALLNTCLGLALGLAWARCLQPCYSCYSISAASPQHLRSTKMAAIPIVIPIVISSYPPHHNSSKRGNLIFKILILDFQILDCGFYHLCSNRMLETVNLLPNLEVCPAAFGGTFPIPAGCRNFDPVHFSLALNPPEYSPS
jgi:hypothetical protein